MAELPDFELSTDVDIGDEQTKPANTLKNTAWAFRVFELWREEASTAENPIEQLISLRDEKLNSTLIRFICEARKVNGEKYPGRTLYSLAAGILRYLRDHGIYDQNFLSEHANQFTEFRRFLDENMRKLTAEGIGGEPKSVDRITPEMEDQMWDSGVFGDHSSDSLLNTVYFYNCKLFGLRARDVDKELTCDQFKFGRDSDGKYVEFTGRPSKTFKAGLKQRKQKSKYIKQYSRGATCIVSLYETYLRLVGGDGPFYRRPQFGSVQFSKQVLGINHLATRIKQICRQAGLEGNFSRHSIPDEPTLTRIGDTSIRRSANNLEEKSPVQLATEPSSSGAVRGMEIDPHLQSTLRDVHTLVKRVPEPLRHKFCLLAANKLVKMALSFTYPSFTLSNESCDDTEQLTSEEEAMEDESVAFSSSKWLESNGVITHVTPSAPEPGNSDLPQQGSEVECIKHETD